MGWVCKVCNANNPDNENICKVCDSSRSNEPVKKEKNIGTKGSEVKQLKKILREMQQPEKSHIDSGEAKRSKAHGDSYSSRLRSREDRRELVIKKISDILGRTLRAVYLIVILILISFTVGLFIKTLSIGGFNRIFMNLKAVFQAIWSQISAAFGSSFLDVVDHIWKRLSGVFENLKSIWSTAFVNINSGFNSYKDILNIVINKVKSIFV